MIDKTSDASSVEAEEAAAFEEAFTANVAGDDSSAEASEESETKPTSRKEEEGGEEETQEEVVNADETEDGGKESEDPAKEEKKATLRDTAEDAGTGKAIKLPTVAKHPDLKEGDFTIEADGKYLVHSEPLGEDIRTILDNDAEEFIKIFKAKPDKAEAIARIIGVKPDATRSPGRVFADVVLAMRTASKEQAEFLVKNHIPTLADPNGDVPFSLAYAQQQKATDDKGVVEERVESEQEILNATYQVVAERAGDVSLEEVLDSAKASEFFQETLTDSKGKPLSVYDRVLLAVDHAFPKGRDREGTDDDARSAAVAGTGAGAARGASTAVNGVEAEESAAFEAALSVDM